MEEIMAEQQPVEEQKPNLYNAKKSWHTPDKPSQGDADGLFFERQENQATSTDEESDRTPESKQKGTNYKFPNLSDGVKGIKFIFAAKKSSNNNSKWVKL